MLLLTACATPRASPAQAAERDALAAVVEAMSFRQSVRGDSIPFDACHVYEKTGRPAMLVSRVPPGLRNLLDRQVDDPCSLPAPSAHARFKYVVRVDSVVVTDSTALVYLYIRRGEWSYSETYDLVVRPGDGQWRLREARGYGGFQILPPPPRAPAQG
ncbi:MAG TPA: hypothetical protein VFQ45_09780 [Longimicrobium sp.]|nr:hypothetical protein [Longimicrobium sp.]